MGNIRTSANAAFRDYAAASPGEEIAANSADHRTPAPDGPDARCELVDREHDETGAITGGRVVVVRQEDRDHQAQPEAAK